MIIGVPREIKPGEQRVALTPAGARAMVEASHGVVVERGAGAGSSIRDEEYTTVGAELASVDEVWRRAELVLKVKEPLEPEVARLRPKQVLFTYLHLAPVPELTRGLRDSGAIAISYETVQRADGSPSVVRGLDGRVELRAKAHVPEEGDGWDRGASLLRLRVHSAAFGHFQVALHVSVDLAHRFVQLPRARPAEREHRHVARADVRG